MTELRDAMAGLAEDAPSALPDGHQVWGRGRRRQRRRRMMAVAASAVLVVGTGLGLGALSTPDTDPGPSNTPSTEWRIPRDIRAPSPWTEGTADAGELGHLAAIGLGERTVPRGWSDSVSYSAVFGVSAVDGTARWLDFRSRSGSRDGEAGFEALSPDGRYVAFGHFEGESLIGWDLYDATTGKVRRLGDPGTSALVPGVGYEIAFTADSRYLQTAFAPAGSPGSRQDSLILWDVETGERTEAEGPGRFWLPGRGTTVAGALWTHGRTAFTYDPATERRGQFRIPAGSYDVSQGRELLAVLVDPDTQDTDAHLDLRVGADLRHLTSWAVPFDAWEIRGWADPDHVVVADFTGRYAIVGVEGVVTEVDFSVQAAEGQIGDLAEDLWANPMGPAMDPPDVGDPRAPWRIATYTVGGALLLGVVGLWQWRRRRAR